LIHPPPLVRRDSYGKAARDLQIELRARLRFNYPFLTHTHTAIRTSGCVLSTCSPDKKERISLSSSRHRHRTELHARSGLPPVEKILFSSVQFWRFSDKGTHRAIRTPSCQSANARNIARSRPRSIPGSSCFSAVSDSSRPQSDSQAQPLSAQAYFFVTKKCNFFSDGDYSGQRTEWGWGKSLAFW